MGDLSPLEESEARFTSIWADALKNHAAMHGHRLDDVSSLNPTSVDSLLREIDRQQATFSDYRSKRHALFNALSTALKPVELLAHLAAGGTELVWPPGHVVFGAVQYLINAGQGVSACYNEIIDLFTEVKDFTARLSIHARQDISQGLKEIITYVLISLVRICDLSAKVIKDGRVRKYVKGIFLGKDEQVQEELKNLRRLTASEERMVGALTLSKVNDINTAVTDVNGKLSTLILAADESKRERKDDDHHTLLERIRDYLQPSTFAKEIFDSVSRKRLPGTGDWIRTEPLFRAWVDRESPILWLNGGPGSGKSFLAANVIQYLFELYPQGVQDPRRISVAYFYCKEYDIDLRSFNKALRSLIYQICLNDPVYAKHCMSVFSVNTQIRSTEALWNQLLVDFFRKDSHDSSVLILMDGLDETYDDDRREFFELLKDLEDERTNGRTSKMQVIMLGRPEINWDIQEVLGDRIPSICVSAEKTSEDMREYIVGSVGKANNLRRVSKELQQETINALTQGADGMFIWVDLMIKEISAKNRVEKIRQTLAKPPKGLSDTLCQVLERFSNTLQKEEVADLNELLAWVVCAQRQLTLEDLDAVLRLKSSDGEGVIDLEGELRHRYASFFTLVREDGRTTEDLQTNSFDNNELLDSQLKYSSPMGSPGTTNEEMSEDIGIASNPKSTLIHLAHASIGDFFRHDAASTKASVGIDIQRAETFILRRCLSLWCQDELFTRWTRTNFYDYAAHNWPRHLNNIDLSMVPLDIRAEIGAMLLKTIRDEACLGRWIGIPGEINMLWSYSDVYTSSVMSWLKDEGAASQLDGSDKTWIASLAGVDVARPMMLLFAKNWLTGVDWSSMFCFRAIWAHMQKTLSIEGKGDPPKDDPNVSELGATAILDAARWNEFEKTSTWHIRVGAVLREAMYLNEAIEQLEAALRLDDKYWLAWSSLAWCYYKSGNQAKALESMENARKLLSNTSDPTLNRSILGEILGVMGDLSLEISGIHAALDKYREAFEAIPWEHGLAFKILRMLEKEKRYSEIMSLLEMASADILPTTGTSRLTEYLTNLFPIEGLRLLFLMSRAGFETGRLDFVHESLKVSLQVALKTRKMAIAGNIQYWLGMFTLRALQDEERAIRIWEQLMAASYASDVMSDLGRTRSMTANELAMCYLEKARRAGQGAAECDRYLGKLETLSRQVRPSKKLEVEPHFYNPLLSTRDTTLVLGSLYQLLGRHQQANECFRTHLKLAVEILTDDDPYNDMQGFWKVADTCVRAQSDDHAAAAYSSIGKTTTGLLTDETSDISFTCDGSCGKEDSPDGFFVCRSCIDVAFCGECTEALKNGGLPWMVCGPEHEFYEVPTTQRLPKGKVLYKGEEVELDRWIEELRKELERLRGPMQLDRS